jgi:hypothetical protein
MKCLALQLCLAAGLSAIAWADETRVHATATVEVLDDKTPIEDVISRMRKEPAPHAEKPAGEALKEVRPTLPPGAEPARRVGPEPKAQPPGSRRRNREPGGNPEPTERPARHHHHHH